MTPQQITAALESIHKLLEIIEEDAGWKEISTAETAHPDLPSDMGDALHYLSELIWKIDSKPTPWTPESVKSHFADAVEKGAVVEVDLFGLAGYVPTKTE